MTNDDRRARAPQAASLASPPVRIDHLALFLDMDGVLAPLAPTPDAVAPTPRRTAVLTRLDQALDGRLAIVSGRTLDEIDRISGAPTLAASGVHGLERRRRDGTFDTAVASPAVAQATVAMKAFGQAHPGVLIEEKGLAVGLHYRAAPDAGPAALDLADRLAASTGLTPQPGHMVVELKTPGADKGVAVAAFMAEADFRGATPVMLGDDLTDEHAFRAAAKLGGFGVLVGPMRETAAAYRLEDQGEVLDWLEAVAEALSPADRIHDGAAA